MPALDAFGEAVPNPDELKVPESPHHRRVAEAIAAAVHYQLGAAVVCYRDMNWYPLDGGSAIAPDVMVLPPGTLATRAKSYRQPADGPTPSVVVEIPSDSDSFAAFRTKLRRLQHLGPVVYVIVAEEGSAAVLRLGAGETEPVAWNGRPMQELGGVVATVDPHAAGITLHTSDGLSFDSAESLQSELVARGAASSARAAASSARAAALEARLRSLGLDPDLDPDGG